VDSSLYIAHTNLSSSISSTNPINRRASPAFLSFSTFLSFSRTSVTTQLAGVNLSVARQSAEVNMSMPHSQGMESSAKPILEPLVISYKYNNNQPADPNL